MTGEQSGSGVGSVRGRAQAFALTADGAMSFAVAAVAANALNFLFHVFISRLMAPTEYGALGALLGILLVFSVPSSAVQVAITREVALRRAEGTARDRVPITMGPLLVQAMLWAGGAAIVMAVAAPLVQRFLHLESIDPAFVLAAYVVPSIIGLVPRGVLLGELRYRIVGLGILAGTIVRLVAGVVLVRAGAGLAGAIAATVIGEIVTVGALLPAVAPLVAEREDRSAIRVRPNSVIHAIVAFTGFWVATAVDGLLARHYLSRLDSGFYVAAATAARAAMFLPSTIALIALPRFAEAREDPVVARRTLLQALLVVALLGAFVAMAVLAFAPVVIDVLFGRGYEGASAVLGPLAFSSAALGLVNVLVSYHLAIGSRIASAGSWFAVVGLVAATLLLDPDIEQLALLSVASTTTAVVLMLVVALSNRPTDRPVIDPGIRELYDVDEPTCDVTVVVPFYNPGPALASTIESLAESLGASPFTFEIITVSDGSTDGSELTLDRVRAPGLRQLLLARNSGKGAALRLGMTRGRGRYVGFIDADGDIDPLCLVQMLDVAVGDGVDIVIGSKRHPASSVEYPPIRRLYSWGFQLLIRVLFRLDAQDTQTGVKVVRRDVLAAILPRLVENRFVFDLELLAVARRFGFTGLVEMPVAIDHRFTSTINLRAVRRMVRDTFAVFVRLRLLRTYDEVTIRVEELEPSMQLRRLL